MFSHDCTWEGAEGLSSAYKVENLILVVCVFFGIV